MLMNMEDKIKKMGSMKEDFVRRCRELNAESSEFYVFSLQWKDLEDYLDNVQKGIEDRYKELKVLEREVEGSFKEVEFKEREMSSVKRKMEVYEAEMVRIEGKIGSLEKLIEGRTRIKNNAVKEEEIECPWEEEFKPASLPPAVVPNSSHCQGPQENGSRILLRKRL